MAKTPTTQKRGTAYADITAHIGARLRLRRTLLGMSQEKLGEAIGLTFQQIQKYERGANRISASLLVVLADKLDVPVSYFYDGIEAASRPAVDGADPMTRRETLELVRAYDTLPDTLRSTIRTLVRSMADSTTHHANA